MSKAQRLRDYFNSLTTTQDKIRAMVYINELFSNNDGYFDEEEKAEFERICYEFYYPTKLENGVVKPDAELFRERAAAIQEMSLEALNYVTDAARRFYADALEERGETVLEKEKFNSSGEKEIEYEDMNWTMAVMKAGQLPELGFYTYAANFATNMNMRPTDNTIKLYEDELLKMDDFNDFLRDEAKQSLSKAGAPYNDEFEEEYKKYIKNQAGGGIVVKLHAFLFDEALKNKYPGKESDITSVSNSCGADYDKENLEKCGFDYNQSETIRKYALFEKTAKFGKPWERDIKKKNGIYIKQISKVGPADNLTPDELIGKMGQISQLYTHMQRTMRSFFRDNDQYKKMTDAMRKVTELYGDGNAENLKSRNNINKCRLAMKAVLETAGNYIDAHSTNRSSSNGKNRFEAAIAAAAIVNEDAASRITEKVNEIRRKHFFPQNIDLRTVSQHLPMVRFKNPEIKEQLQTLKAKNKNPLSQEEYLNSKDTAISRSSRKYLTNKITGIGKVDLDRAAKLTSIDPIIGSPERAGSMILSYAKWKHPEDADMTASEMLNNDRFSNAAGEFAKFLEENAIYEEDGKTLLGDEKVRTSMKNLAEFRSAFVKSIKNKEIPDYSNTDVRSTCFEETVDLRGQIVEFYQNYSNLDKINLEKKSGKAFFFDEYPDGMDGYFQDEDFLTNYGYFLQCELNIDDPKAPLGKRVVAKLITDRISHELKGQTAEEYFTSEEGKKCISEAMIIDSVFSGVSIENKLNAEKKECMDYISGKGPMPDVVWKRMQKKEKMIREQVEIVKQAKEMEHQGKRQKYLAEKEGEPVQKIDFSNLQEDRKKEAKHEQPDNRMTEINQRLENRSRNEIKHEQEEEEIFPKGFKRKRGGM